MSRVVSSLSGRIRIRDKRLRNQARMNELKKELLKIAAITHVQDSIRTGSVVVNFDLNDIEIAVLETKMESVVDKILGETLMPPLLTKKEVNRYNKIAMVGSLAASLAFAAVGKKRWRRWHIATGYLFVANLGVHLYIYRKTLFR